jgi:hypothetical protein
VEQDRDGLFAADHQTHATTGGAAAAGAITGVVVGLVGGPVTAAIGALGARLLAWRPSASCTASTMTSTTTIDAKVR